MHTGKSRFTILGSSAPDFVLDGVQKITRDLPIPETDSKVILFPNRASAKQIITHRLSRELVQELVARGPKPGNETGHVSNETEMQDDRKT